MNQAIAKRFSGRRQPSIAALLSRPISGWWCALGWVFATAVFVLVVQALGGPSPIDSNQSVDSTMAIAHGEIRCSFPSGPQLTAPFYPFLSAGFVAATNIGHSVPFPTASAMGPHCGDAFNAINAWIDRSHVETDLLRYSYTGWLFLLVGLVLLLRAGGRGKCGWEPITIILVAVLPPVWLSLESSFHPQDLIALGFAMSAIAAALRGKWIAAGVLVTVAVLTQQFAILIAVPLFFVAPARYRFNYLAAAGGTALVTLSALVAVSPRAVEAALIGTGNTLTSDTLVMTIHLHGVPLIALSRIFPVAVSGVLSWWLVHRFRSDLPAVAVVSLMALSVALRLVFEQNIFGYYFMALTVFLLIGDALTGRIRESLVAWLLLVSLVYLVGDTTTYIQLSRVSWGHVVQLWATPLVAVVALLCLLRHVLRRAPTRALPWLALLLATVLVWPSTRDPLSDQFSRMFWQVALVASGIALAGLPLHAMVRQAGDETRRDHLQLAYLE